MARRLTAAELQRRADIAEAREQYYYNKNKNPETFNSTVEDVPRIKVGYRSYNMMVGSPGIPASLQVLASQTACQFFEGVSTSTNLADTNAALGLVYVATADYVPVTKFTTSKIKAVIGGTKVPVATPWGSRYIKYTRNAEGSARNSYTAPISEKGTGAFAFDDVKVNGLAIANREGFRTALGDNGRLWLEPESEQYSLLS